MPTLTRDERWELRSRRAPMGSTARFRRDQTGQRIAREHLRQLIAREYNIPITEQSERILHDDDGDLEERRDDDLGATRYNTYIHRVAPIGTDRYEPTYGHRLATNGYASWEMYTPAGTGSHFIMSNQYHHRWLPQYNAVTNGDWTMTNDETWADWVTYQSTAATTASYAITDNQFFRNDYRYVISPAQSRAWDRWEILHREEVVPVGHIRDWETRDIITAEEYATRQVAREAAANLRREQQQAAALVLQQERAEAERRADALLTSILDAAQRARYIKDGVVEVLTASGRLMHLERGWAGNALELHPQTRRRIRRYCIHPRESMPLGDNIAAQVLLLQHDEALFFQTANASVV